MWKKQASIKSIPHCKKISLFIPENNTELERRSTGQSGNIKDSVACCVHSIQLKGEEKKGRGVYNRNFLFFFLL